jgi:hypothetical protein
VKYSISEVEMHKECMGELRNAYRILVGRPLYRYNIIIYLKEIEWEGMK